MPAGTIHIVGGGLAGSEAAWQCLQLGLSVTLHEMRPNRLTEAHQTGNFAELVCSNSLKSVLPSSAPGQLKFEMQALGSLIIEAGFAARVPAGQALAVNREEFSTFISDKLASHAKFTRQAEEVCSVPTEADLNLSNECWIIATGPLTSSALVPALQRLAGSNQELFFYDAIAPIIDAESIDTNIAFKQNRYGEDEGDYLNLPFSKEEYDAFIDAAIAADKMPLHAFETTKYFEACLPIEVMIERGRDTLRFGPMKPVGITDPRTGRWPYANVQLRMENAAGTMYSMVGFQTKMTWPAQKQVFALIPGLKNAEFLRFGSVHRNFYLKSPMILNSDLSFKSSPRVFLAGQITGVEGYTESAAIGLLAARAAAEKMRGNAFQSPPKNTVIGALLDYVTNGGRGEFQPMNANLGLLPPVAKIRQQSKADRKEIQCSLARQAIGNFLEGTM